MTALSCYTTNLVEYLLRENPGARWRLAEAIRLGVRPDPPGEGLVFSQHTRIDRDASGRELAYRGAASWAAARTALADELARHGRVLAVTDTAHLPWSPYPADAHGPHWILLLGRDRDRWHVVDRFAALTMHGRQRPHEGWLTDDELRLAMSPVPAPLSARDAYALGERVELPPLTHYRWLAKVPATTQPVVHWSTTPVPTLRLVAERLVADEQALAEHVDDLWAAGVHQQFRLGLFVERGLVAPEQARPVVAAWTRLQRPLRFAVESARRGKPRPDLVATAFDRLVAATEATLPALSEV
ncbi:hypothetical protein [Labedaea rhizosphaerae]|uniref:Butirosin biosynthesis protein H-like n=1 Tax=Labedaea rhizosphaerae TaxID=598644 RepID=A0A4V3CXJ8_LABRH|nr:hypothetical protein [Labedaea rhizosphaerae]TDP90598.1 hypothetical protein EV186_110139 [Labedaea rhizosphaerae]